MFGKLITDDVKDIIKDYLSEGAIAIDLTAGNGNDTLFLASNVGQAGKVYGFDVQTIAIENTKKRLERHGLVHRVTLIQDGHEKINNYIHEEIDVAMMNLGYLPSGDKGIITKADTTIKAIEDTIAILKKGGLFSIVLYYGHKGGLEEKALVEGYLSSLNSKYVDVLSVSYSNRGAMTPIVKIIKKR